MKRGVGVQSVLLWVLSILTSRASAQYGYVKLEGDSVLKGYIRSFRDITAEEGLEIWKTKTDKKPSRIFKSSIVEYAIKKDTIKVLHNFTPFNDNDILLNNVDAHYLVRGKINLLRVPNPEYRRQGISVGSTAPTMGVGIARSLIPKFGEEPFIYLLEQVKSERFFAVPPKKKDLNETLLNFFSESFISRYEQKFGEIKYKNLRHLIEFYNSK